MRRAQPRSTSIGRRAQQNQRAPPALSPPAHTRSLIITKDKGERQETKLKVQKVSGSAVEHVSAADAGSDPAAAQVQISDTYQSQCKSKGTYIIHSLINQLFSEETRGQNLKRWIGGKGIVSSKAFEATSYKKSKVKRLQEDKI